MLGAAQLIVAPGSSQVFELITERIRDIAGDAIVAASEFEPHGSVLIVRCVRCSDSDRAVLRKLFGRDPEGLPLHLSDEIRKQWKAGGMDRLAGGVHELVFGMLPASACEQAERELGATGVFAMACSYEQDILGTVAVISREAHPLKKQKLIEALIAQSGLALKRSRADASVRAANEKLIEADRGKSEFLAVLSHELRNPLAPINSATLPFEATELGKAQTWS